MQALAFGDFITFLECELKKTDNSPQHPDKKRRKLLVHTDQLGVDIYILPNLVTTMNMFFGFFSIIRTIRGEFTIAAYAIVAAAIFDLLDGRVARITKTESPFGAQYDSLCDLVSFGIAPALLLFLWSLEPFGRIGWLSCFFFAACGALRLARFNVYTIMTENDEVHTEADSKSYFYGLPIPMAAGIVASAVLAFRDQNIDPRNSLAILIITFLAGIAMVSNFPYRSFKDIDLKERLPFEYLVLGVAILAFVAIRPEITLFVLFVTYAGLGLLVGFYKKFFRKKAKK